MDGARGIDLECLERDGFGECSASEADDVSSLIGASRSERKKRYTSRARRPAL